MILKHLGHTPTMARELKAAIAGVSREEGSLIVVLLKLAW